MRSVTEPTGTGTRSAAPVRRPSSSGMTRPMARAAPEEVGMMEEAAAHRRASSLPLSLFQPYRQQG